MMDGYTYIMSNKTRTTFYIGVTNDLKERIHQHIPGFGSQFTTKYINANIWCIMSISIGLVMPLKEKNS